MSVILDLGRLRKSNGQARKRHQSPKQAGYDTQRQNARSPDEEQPADPAKLYPQCCLRRHQ
jgi:hypothetical protein